MPRLGAAFWIRAGAVDYASHDCDFHFFDAGIAVFPGGHLLAQVGLNLLGHFLEEGAGKCSAAASGAGCDLRGEAANAERLQNLLCDTDFFGAVAAGGGRKRNANGIADAFLQQNAERGAGGDDAFCAHARFGQSEMQRIIASRVASAR